MVELPNMHTSGMPKSSLHRAPQMRRHTTDDGREADACFIGDAHIVSLGAVTQAGRRFDDTAELDFVEVCDDVRHGAYRPDAMTEELDLDGVCGAVLQPSQGLFWDHLDDTEPLTGICYAYNGWIVDSQEDPLVVKDQYHIGIHNFIWGNNYPHSESTWPKSVKYLEFTPGR